MLTSNETDIILNYSENILKQMLESTAKYWGASETQKMYQHYQSYDAQITNKNVKFSVQWTS